MKVFKSLKEIDNIESTVIALGNFDGVHKGHQELITRTVKSAEIAGVKSAVFTFSNHPRNITDEKNKVKTILYWEEKVSIIEALGIDYMFNIPFSREIQVMSPVEFIDRLLIDSFKMKELYCGFNYKFGYKGAGNPMMLLQEALKKNFGIHVMEPYEIDGKLVSSTYIRELISEGDMRQCCKFLGRYYSIGGEVVVGNKLGRTLGFPTSNIVVDEMMITPPNGVYMTYCTYNGVRYPSVTNVGVKPTIGNYKKNVETHIFNFDKELYGKHIRVEFLDKSREEKKFDSVEELSKQITDDCIMAKVYHRVKV